MKINPIEPPENLITEQEFETLPEEKEMPFFQVVFCCFICENEWVTRIPALTNVIMSCPRCWNQSGMRDDIVYRALYTEH